MRAAAASLPTSRLARAAEARSAAPERVTPMAAHPGRPRSWTVASGPGASTVSTAPPPPEAHPGPRPQQGRRIALDVEEDGVGAADQLPAAGRGARVDPGVGAGEAERPGRHPRARGLPARHVQSCGRPVR